MTTTTSTGDQATAAEHHLQPVVITSARGAASDELSGRVRRYTLAMAFRMACFLSMLVIDGWLRWALLAVAVFMPYLAVVLANQADHRSPAPLEGLSLGPATAITAGQALADGPGEVISGEVIDADVVDADVVDGGLADADSDERLGRAA